VFIVIFLAMLAGAFTFYLGGFFERGQADLTPVLQLPSLAVPVPGAGGVDAPVGRGAQERQHRAADDPAGHDVAGGAGQVPGRLGCSRRRAGADLPDLDHGQLPRRPDNGVIFAGYLGSLLMAGGFLAIGACISAPRATRSIAFILTVVICFVFLLAGFPLVLNFFSGWLPTAVLDAISGLSFLTHFSSLSKGVLDIRDVLYFLLVIAAWLYANVIVLDLKKAD
jgi:ABC-2 type transport system permease protein